QIEAAGGFWWWPEKPRGRRGSRRLLFWERRKNGVPGVFSGEGKRGVAGGMEVRVFRWLVELALESRGGRLLLVDSVVGGVRRDEGRRGRKEEGGEVTAPLSGGMRR
ncbi:hypothetical protein HAX54_046710, partial [Datura stramonium]|nr:hypothetical protein [Datura stramonium]